MNRPTVRDILAAMPKAAIIFGGLVVWLLAGE